MRKKIRTIFRARGLHNTQTMLALPDRQLAAVMLTPSGVASAASRRPGPSRNWTPALSCAITVAKRSPTSILRMNRGGFGGEVTHER